MPDVKTDKRFTRVMKFLVASSEGPIAKMLATRGFSDEDRQEGWGLFDTAAGRHLAIMPGSGTFSTQYRVVIGSLDNWENNWFDVADAAWPAVSGRSRRALQEPLQVLRRRGGAYGQELCRADRCA